MRKSWSVVAMLLFAVGESSAQELSLDAVNCINSGGTWEENSGEEPKCTCPAEKELKDGKCVERTAPAAPPPPAPEPAPAPRPAPAPSPAVVAICDNGTCESMEDVTNCPEDCPGSCGDHVCHDRESCSSCETDCGACPAAAVASLPDDVMCTELCRGSGGSWNPDAEPEARCEPVDDPYYKAGPCMILAKSPFEENLADHPDWVDKLETILHRPMARSISLVLCEKSGGRFNELINSSFWECRCPVGMQPSPSTYTCVPVLKRRWFVGLDGGVTGFASSGDTSLGGALMAGIRAVRHGRKGEVVFRGGELFAGTDEAAGLYLGGNYALKLSRRWGFAAGPHLHYVGLDRRLDAKALNAGAEFGPALRWPSFRVEALLDLGLILPEAEVAVGYSLRFAWLL